MAGIPRPAAPAVSRKNSMRPPIVRPSIRDTRTTSTTLPTQPDHSRPPSRAESIMSSQASPSKKRKERDFDHDGPQETNINVVVRCRGRNEREVRENSGVVLQTDGVRGRSVELSMGPNALSNKTYHFDKAFSPAADQSMIFDDVVVPMLDEMLAGYNCTIFAYGQTGTGKTYTMTGDMSNTMGILPDAAGIIPRVLYSLFERLEADDAESSVKCSFIELYNEELRDLVATDDTVKLKIYEDNNGKSKSGTIVQGMEECHIKNAQAGIKLLQGGSHKRQVAATKCNDLSSRSHTVFTVTAYIKRTTETGEDYVSAGKLNLVDLAGSENIQRSGAENKRAAEAGLINKSLLTLGRVINALVERGSHIPYRESKLTRLLQDSLGGRTKTCIIATVSPAKSNLEETISTLDYAFRAKNIKNKPQVNQMVQKKTLLKEFTQEIEKLRSELIATRQRNGVYLTNESYEEIQVESESRKILSEEQAAKIEIMEGNLRNKVQELFSLTSNFMKVKKDFDTAATDLDATKTLLEQTDLVLATTQQSLIEEAILRKAHETTEGQLSEIGRELITTIGRTVSDIGGLHSKNRRRSELHAHNRRTWGLSQAQVTEVTNLVEDRVEVFRSEQERVMLDVSCRMQAFVESELKELSSTKDFLQDNIATFESSEQEVLRQTDQAKSGMDDVLEGIKVLREEVKVGVGHGLQGVSAAAARISEEVMSELGTFHTQLHSSYSSLGKDFKGMFEELLRHIDSQRIEAEKLRQQLTIASDAAMAAKAEACSKLEEILSEERQQAAFDRQNLLAQITGLINSQGETQDVRLTNKIGNVQRDILASKEMFEVSRNQYSHNMDLWNSRETKLVDDVLKSRETLKGKLKDDWLIANKHNSSLQTATQSVQQETVQIVDEQMKNISIQMLALDDFVTRARLQNVQHHTQHLQSLGNLSKTVHGSYDNIAEHFDVSYQRIRDIGHEMSSKTSSMREALVTLDTTFRQPLAELRTCITGTHITEYQPTGETPQKTQYSYTSRLPKTESHDTLLATMRNDPASQLIPSPTKSIIFHDPESPILDEDTQSATLPSQILEAATPGLREIDINVNRTQSLNILDKVLDIHTDDVKPEVIGIQRVFKQSISRTGSAGKIPRVTTSRNSKENLPPGSLGVSTGGLSKRRSPRTTGT